MKVGLSICVHISLSIIDRNERNGQFLILGSASRDLLRQSFISAFLERDLVSLGFNIPPLTMHRLWKMCANQHGQLINLSQFGGSLGISHTTVRKYLDLLKETFMVRILLPMDTNLNKRLIKAPKVYLRDSGILHTLLNIHTKNELLGHPIVGASWEGMVIEQMISLFGEEDSGFYRTAGGAELDLVVRTGNRKIAIECKASLAPRLERGFYQAMEDLQINEAWVISPVEKAYPLKKNVWVMPLREAISDRR